MLHYSPREAADKTGFSLDTLRYYEKIGLLASIARSSGGRRVFTDDDLAWLHILRCLRQTGMPIAGMLRYAKLARGGDDTIADRLRLLEEHDRAITEHIALLRARQLHIREKIQWYRSSRSGRRGSTRGRTAARRPRAGAGTQAVHAHRARRRTR